MLLNINIVTEYPLWFILFCLILGFLYAFILYHKDKKNDFPKMLLRVMSLFRFFSIFIISFLLLSPLLKTIFRYVEKPIIIVAQDNSQSIVMGKDSSFYKNDYVNNIKKLVKNFNKNYIVKTYNFGDKTSNKINYKYTDRQTDISQLFDEITTRYSNCNLGAIILASDGIYNKGINPVYSAKEVKSPVYTIALGDTNIQKDVIIKKLNYNKITYLGNKFPLQVIVRANKCKGLSSRINISKKNKILCFKKIDFNTNTFSQTFNFMLEAKSTGLQRYKVNLSPVKDEISISNNNTNFFVNVINSKQKILILANSPHPDVSALKQSIESNYNYKTDAFIINDFDKSVSGYNLVILHQIPSTDNPSSQLLSSLADIKIPVLYIIGSQSNIEAFNNQKTGLNISNSKYNFDEALPFTNNTFTLFTLSKETRKVVSNFSPLMSPFGKYKTQNFADILFYQKIGDVITKQPLILFSPSTADNIKTGVILGEGIWKWRLNNYLQQNNHNAFDEIINKIVQYLSVKEDKSHFRITCKNDFPENEPVEFDAQVYNDSYELINEPEINMLIINKDNKKFPFVFARTSDSYHLNAGTFPVGVYKYTAKIKIGSKLFQKKGEFSISSLNIESINTVADHHLLYNLAKAHDGEMFYPQQINKLTKTLNLREDIKPVSYTQKRFMEIINLKWIFFLIIALLTAEWFLRKRNGAY